MKKPNLSLRAQVAILLAIAILPIGVLAVAQGYVTYDEARDLRRTALAIEATKASTREQGAIREAFGALDALQSQIDPVMPVEPCNAIMRAYVDNDDEVSFGGVAFADGIMRCGHPLEEPLDLRGTPEYKRFIEEPRRVVTVYEKGAISGEAVVVASAPLYRDGELAGSIAISTPSKYLSWANAADRDSGAHFAIVDGRGTRVAGQQDDPDDDWLPAPQKLKTLLRNARSTGVLSPAAGGDRIYAVTPLFENDIFSVSSWPVDRRTLQITPVQILMLLLPLVMWGMAVAVAYFAVDRFALRHVVYLDRLVSAYTRSKGGLRASGVREAPLEFAKLGESFDLMAQGIEDREHALRGSVAEKDALLKEVYHRVKNNLQLVCSLVNLQLRDARNEHEREGLQRLQDRVYGLAAVHQRLSEAERVSAVRIDSLLTEIVQKARETRDGFDNTIEVTMDLIPYSEGPDRAIPIALFATEAIANAFEHALKSLESGWLHVSLSEVDADNVLLEITNALSEEAVQPSASRSGLGSQLIQGFTSQLRGNLERDIEPGKYSLRLRFPRAQD